MRPRSGAGGVLGFGLIAVLNLPFVVCWLALAAGLAGFLIWGLLGRDLDARVTAIRATQDGRGRPEFFAKYVLEDGARRRTGEVKVKSAEFDALKAQGAPEMRMGILDPINSIEGPPVRMTLRILDAGSWQWVDKASNFMTDWRAIGLCIGLDLWMFWLIGGHFGRHLHSWWRCRSLYRLGIATRGVVVCKRHSRATRFWIDYAFTTPDGHQHKATQRVDMLLFQQVREGEEVTVLHFEGKPKPSVVYEYGGFRCG